jgi:hypothetical protein
VKEILLAPRTFYAGMPARGGVAEALIFLLVLEVIAGIIKGAGYLYTGGPATMQVLWGIMFFPFLVVLFSFVVAGLLWLVWFLLGSRLPYETAYRCFAFTAAIAPVTTLVQVIPTAVGLDSGVGWLVSMGLHLAWMMVLLAIASEEVHEIPRWRSRITFSVLGIALLGSWGYGEHWVRTLPDIPMQQMEERDSAQGEAGQRREQMQRQLERSQPGPAESPAGPGGGR